MTAPTSILIVRMSSIGDIILASPVLRQLRKQYPAAKIDFLVRAEYADLVRKCPYVDTVHVFDVRTGMTGLLKLANFLHSRKYDTIIDLHGNLRSMLIRAKSGCRQKFNIKKRRWSRLLWVKYRRGNFERENEHVARKYLQSCTKLLLDPDDVSTEVFLDDEIRMAAEGQAESVGLTTRFIALAPGARHGTKMWPESHYVELISDLQNKYEAPIVLLGGPAEQPLLESIAAAIPNDQIYNFAGKLSLMESIAFIERARLFVSNDSGLMHAAAALNIPQIALFGATTPSLGFAPLNDSAIVLEKTDLTCRPCSHIGGKHCPQKHFKCLRDISAKNVMQSIAKLPGFS